MGLEKGLTQPAGRYQESPELLREHILFPDVEPGLGGELVLQGGWPGNAPKAAFREQAKLIVVVADHPPVPGHAEILQQHVPGEDVGRREILDRVAVIDRCLPGRRSHRRAGGRG